MPTKRRPKNRARTYDGKHIWDLLCGPGDGPRAPSYETCRELWEGGGRTHIMGSYFDERPGSRPWAWWCFDFPEEAKREVEQEHSEHGFERGAYPDPMTILEAFGFARDGERDAYAQMQREYVEQTGEEYDPWWDCREDEE